jgi:hypothetical protein
LGITSEAPPPTGQKSVGRDDDGVRFAASIQHKTEHTCKAKHSTRQKHILTRQRSVGRDDDGISVDASSKLALVSDDKHLSAASLDLLGGDAHALRVLIVKDDHEDWGGSLRVATAVSRDECEGAVLERSAGEALGVEIALRREGSELVRMGVW